MKSLLKVFYIVVLSGSVFYIYQNRYVKLTPLVLIKDDLQEIELKPEEVVKFKLILDKYDEPYKIYDETIYIKNSLANDKELVWNYTTKALRLP